MTDVNNQNQDDSKTKDQDPNKEPNRINDPAEIVNNPDAIATLLESKRKATAEAMDYRKKLEALEEKQKKEKQEAEQKALEEQGKYKELNEKLKAEKDETTAKFKAMVIQMALLNEAIKQGINDPDVVALIDVSGVKIDDNYKVETAEEIVKAFKEAKPHFFGEVEEGNPPPNNPKPGLTKVKGGNLQGMTADQKLDHYFNTKK